MTRLVAAALALGALAPCAAAAAAAEQPRGGRGEAGDAARAASHEPPGITVAIVPKGTDPVDLGAIGGLAPGTLSAGLSTVTEAQTFLDISAGNRVFTSLYPVELPVITRFAKRVPGWPEIVWRAEQAPAEIVPGLLGTSVREAGVPIRADSLLTTPALMAADERGRVGRARPFECLDRACPGVAVVPATLADLPRLIRSLRGQDLLIAIERPPPGEREVLALGIAGRGYGGNLTSDTTRTPGFALSTDIAPTILERLGLPVPEEMAGNPIRSQGERDAEAVNARAERMEVVSERRAPVVLRNLIIWLALAGLAAALSRGRAARTALALFGVSATYLPAMLLAAAAVRPEEMLVERLIVGLGAPALAALTWLLLRGWAALALGCAVTLAAYLADVLAGSPLTAQSLLGPNPGLGVRFFGIGNELESTLAVVIPVGVGAALAALAVRGRQPSPRAAAAAFLITGSLAALVFAAGRFGADVGAAIVLPAGAAVAALMVPGVSERLGGRRWWLLLAAAPVLGLAALFAIDLASGGDAHLSRSVLGAGGTSELADVAERRLRLAGRSFERGVRTVLFWSCLAGVVLAVLQRRRIWAWLGSAPLARAGYTGAAASVALGIVSNDSASTFFTTGTIALAACLAFAWSQAERAAPSAEEDAERLTAAPGAEKAASGAEG